MRTLFVFGLLLSVARAQGPRPMTLVDMIDVPLDHRSAALS
jgi:hypothetical protein